MKSFTTLSALWTTYTQNTSSANVALGSQLINDTHRYLLQKFFNNETTYSIATQGAASQNLTTTAGISTGATSATLSSPWVGTTGLINVVFSDGESILVNFTNASTALTWTTPLVNTVTSTISVSILTLTVAPVAGAVSATLTSAWLGNTIQLQVAFSDGEVRMVYFTNGSTALTWNVPLQSTVTLSISVAGQQFYAMPPNYSKMKNVTITQGNLQWPMIEVLTRQEWDALNVFPYYASIPVYFYIFPGGDHGGQVGIWPIPSTTNNVLNYTYKYRVPDLSLTDYTTGNVSVTTKTTAITSSGATFPVTTNIQNESRWIQFAPTATTSTSGDNLWYQLINIPTSSTATLYQPYQGTTITSSTTYTIGQMPLINEDFHDLLVYRPLMIYFSSINKDIDKANQFGELYKDGEERLMKYCGTNTTNVNLGRRARQSNPNLYSQNFG